MTQALELAVKALEGIADPVEHLRRYAEERGNQLDGTIAQSLSNDVGFLKGLATTALTALRSLPQEEVSGWRPTHRHLKRGTEYEVIGRAILQTEVDIGDMGALVVYRARDGQIWARPPHEFNDGRFEELTVAPTQPPPSQDRDVAHAAYEAHRASVRVIEQLQPPPSNPYEELVELLGRARHMLGLSLRNKQHPLLADIDAALAAQRLQTKDGE